MFRREFWRDFDFWLFGAVLLLCIFGLIMINSTIAGNIELANYVNRQATFLGIGMVVLIGTTILDYHYWKSLSRFMYIFILAFLGIILIIGTTSFGSQRWLEVGLVNIQPAEISKIVLILVLAHYFSSKEAKPKNIKWVLISFLIVAGLVVPIYLQPNLSSTILLVVIWFSMLWISGLPTKYVIIFVIAGILIAVSAFPFLEPYQQERILTFIKPDENARYGNTYNVEQALITIGSGGLLGQGYGSGTQVQLRFLKVRSTDYIFSAIAEEFGFIGTILIIAVLVFVIIRCIFRQLWGNDRLWFCNIDRFSNNGKYRCKLKADSCHWTNFTFHQLWWKFTSIPNAWNRINRKRIITSKNISVGVA